MSVMACNDHEERAPEVPRAITMPQVVSDPSPESSAIFRVGIRSLPYLADHGFQNMVVLPGAFYVEMALRVSRELFGRVPRVLRNVTFQHPIILSAEDTAVRVEVRNSADGLVEFAFSEANVDDRGTRPQARHYAATLDIDWTSPSSPAESDEFSIEAFQARSGALIDAKEFYKTLTENGNQYGPRFQHVSSIWRAGGQSLGRISVPSRDAGPEPGYLDPSLLDSVTQLMAPFTMEKGKTFILRSIETIDVTDVAFPTPLWAHASLLSDRDDTGGVGNVRVFDESGRTYVKLSGVAFSTMDGLAAADDSAGMNLVIASNFTAEPVEDCLKFWGDHFGVPIRVEFAPYNQIFQQLLDGGSAFRRNREGVNVILLGLEEWAAGEGRALTLDRDRAERCFGNRMRYVLPNGLEIVHLNQYETDYVYKEIFEEHCYLKHGIHLQDNDIIVDIGANIGLFSLFVLSHCANPQIYAFEPAPAVYELLKANCNAYGASVQALNLGVSDRSSTAAFTFYEKSSVFSSFRADDAEDRAAIQTVVRNTLNSDPSIDKESLDAYVAELTADRLRRTTHECRVTSVSEIIRENQLARINLLKIDAEKSELDIVRGIEDDDWPKIDQIVVEIHDRTREAVQRIEDLLRQKGYQCVGEQETRLEHSGLFNLYATRGERRVESRVDRLQRHLQDFGAALRSFTNQSAVPVILCICPRTPAAESDPLLEAALHDAEQSVLSEAGTLPNVYTVSSTSLMRAYPVIDYYDPHGHQLGHVPYTSDCYAAIGTALVRTIFGLNRHPFKVIALDCDNTLWKGVCGEDGPLGIEVTPHHRALQEFMIGQMNAGMLLCLCSKNNEKDVLDVFDQRRDMVLRREHIVATRINWNSKSANIKSLAGELNLGLDSFILIDDNPVDCGDVRASCPGVLTLQLPPDAGSFSSFLNHIWAFDRISTTAEDHNRTRMYRERKERQHLREHSLALKDFLTELQLRVEIAEAADDQLGRVSQLTFRTNQFNLTTIRRSEDEIRRFIKHQHATCLAVRVVDRFGDYGLVGVVMYEATTDRYKVDTFLLSCRVLGRGVEHAVLSHLAQRAALEGRTWVELTYLPTTRNVPAREFLTIIGDRYRNEAGTSWTIPVEHLARLRYDPNEAVPAGQEVAAADTTAQQRLRSPVRFGAFDRSDRLQRIGEHLCDTRRISKAIEAHRLAQHPLPAAANGTPGGTLETALAAIWSRVLGRPRVGLNDNFFEVGGTSLRAVQVIAAIRKELKQTPSIVTLFECPTVALLAARLRTKSGEILSEATTADAALRGQQRRQRTIRRTAS
jgi:FkbH-like protein/FkbM family methyltransferase